MDINHFLNQYKYYVLAIAAGLIVFTYLLVSFINQPEETLSLNTAKILRIYQNQLLNRLSCQLQCLSK